MPNFPIPTKHIFLLIIFSVIQILFRMKQKRIVIIGAGIYGCSAFLKLKDKYECIIIDKNEEILNGATSNNLNRIHYGYHYPRDQKTVDLCRKYNDHMEVQKDIQKIY